MEENLDELLKDDRELAHFLLDEMGWFRKTPLCTQDGLVGIKESLAQRRKFAERYGEWVVAAIYHKASLIVSKENEEARRKQWAEAAKEKRLLAKAEKRQKKPMIIHHAPILSRQMRRWNWGMTSKKDSVTCRRRNEVETHGRIDLSRHRLMYAV